MEWHFNNDMPIYSQLLYQLKFAIVSGELKPGDKIATVRELANEANVNPNTMQRALQELEREGLAYTHRSNGRYVTEDALCIDMAKRALAKQYIDNFLFSMHRIGFANDEIISLLKKKNEEENDGNNS